MILLLLLLRKFYDCVPNVAFYVIVDVAVTVVVVSSYQSKFQCKSYNSEFTVNRDDFYNPKALNPIFFKFFV